MPGGKTRRSIDR